ncbi:MAG TPA: succinate dehydrogenase/fumarate reductase iron-sulfur subunit [Planctomycetaceae bacterium]|nr:succinate dehydrogenase/fumarate reductase iron-sulfur subunit [Planctomycetaceae bacterium]
MQFTLHVWRQPGRDDEGFFEIHHVDNITDDMSFLEMMDQLNMQLATEAKPEVAYEFDCREGICGTCSLVINGVPHGPGAGATTCQTFMRSFEDGSEIWIEPFRAKAFPIRKDLIVDRSAFDRIQQAGGYVSMNLGSAPDANAIAIPKSAADSAMDAAQCIGCGACVAACVNASASLFVGAKVAHLASVPQGEPERRARVQNMIAVMDEEQFGSCTNHGECEAVCPKEISVSVIAKMNREHLRSVATSDSD